MQTSYFAKKGYSNPVAISLIVPYWFSGPKYEKLAPTKKLLNLYKSGVISKTDYTKQYTSETLCRLDANTVWEDLVNIAGQDATLLCYERAGEFCHRRLVAKWLENELGVFVTEFGYEEKAKPKGLFL